MISSTPHVTLAPVRGFEATGTHRVAAGIWCADPASGQGFDQIHPHPFLNLDTWRSNYSQARSVYEETMTALAAFLDSHHGTSFGREYWEHVTGFFVRIQTDVAVDRAILLRDIVEKHPGAVFIGLDPSAFELPIDTKNFTEALRQSHLANLQVLTQVAQFLRLRVETRDLPQTLRGTGMGAIRVQESAPAASTPSAKPRNFLTGSVVMYKTLLRRRTALALWGYSLGKIRVLQDLDSGVTSRPADAALRANLAATPCDTNLGRLTLTLLAANLPTALVEEWRGRAEALEGLGPSPKVIITGLGSYWNTDFAIWSATARRAGSRYIGVQHGGTYGEREACSFEEHERDVSDAYITWGWSEDIKTVPLPAPRLSGIPRRRRPVTEGPILWVGTSDTPYVYQLGPRPVGPQFLSYFASQRAFLAGLDAGTRSQVLFRPYPNAFGWDDQPGLSEPAVGVCVDDLSKVFHQRMAEARLVVVDHLGSTTILEALSANIPVLCFGSPEDFDIRTSAQARYDLLAEQGLYYRSAGAAATAVNRIAADIPAWWAAPDRQHAARAFADTYARCGGFFSAWQRFLFDQERD